MNISRRTFMAGVSAASVLAANEAVASPPTKIRPWIIPWGDDISDDRIPEPGTIIQCVNGHDVATVVAKRGWGEFRDWPVLSPQSLYKKEMPICCDRCGAIAIAWGTVA